MLGRDRSRAHQGRRGERQAVAADANRHQPGPAFLDDQSGTAGHAAMIEPYPAGAEGGVAGERQLSVGREDSDPVVGLVGLLGCRFEQECGLRQVRPRGEVLHLVRREPLAISNNGERVAHVRHRREYVHLGEGPAHRWSIGSGPASPPLSSVSGLCCRWRFGGVGMAACAGPRHRRSCGEAEVARVSASKGLVDGVVQVRGAELSPFRECRRGWRRLCRTSRAGHRGGWPALGGGRRSPAGSR